MSERFDLTTFLLDALHSAPPECFINGPAWDRAVAEKRQRHDDKPDPKRRLAEHLAREMMERGFEISHPEPVHPGSPPAWRGGR